MALANNLFTYVMSHISERNELLKKHVGRALMFNLESIGL